MSFEPYYIVPLAFVLLVLGFIAKEIRQLEAISSKSDRKLIIGTLLVLFIGVLVRIINLNIPIGIFPDEAMSGYDSWCLANYGVDQHLYSYPAYLKSWGSGMNALYAYLAIPFIKIFGLSLPVFRLPMALLSCATLIISYYTLSRILKNKFLVFIIILLVVVSPWHITKSRFALESNLAPDLILVGTCLLIMGYNAQAYYKQTLYILSGFAVIGLSAYGYAVVWFMLPLYCVFILLFFYKRRKISMMQIGFSLAILAVITLPLIFFAILIVTDGHTLHLGAITIPTLTDGRHEETTILGSGNYWDAISLYAEKAFRLLILGDDTHRWNTFYLFGQFYNVIAIPFILIALIYLKRKNEDRNIFDYLFFLWLVASLPILLLVEPNVTHWNILWFPLIYFAARGVCLCVGNRIWARYMSIGIIIFLSLAFGRKYVTFFFKPDTYYISGFRYGHKEYLDFVKTKKINCVYFSEIYPFTLFNDPISPYEYNKVKIERIGNYPFERVSAYGNYRFYIPEDIEPLPKTAYLIRNDKLDLFKVEQDKFHIEKGITFTLLWNE